MQLSRVLFVSIFYLLQTPISALANTISEQLILLDDLRLKDSTSFSIQINELIKNHDDAALTKAESKHLKLLYAWDLTRQGKLNLAQSVLAEIGQSTDHALSLRVSGLLVNIHTLQYQYSDAFEHSERLLSQLSSLTNPKFYLQIMGPVMMLYNNIERYDIVNQLVITGLKNNEDSSLRCRLLTQRLQGLYKTEGFGVYNSAFEDTHQLCGQSGEVIFQLLIIRNHMFYLLEQQQAAAALAFYQQYYPQVEQINYPILTAGFNAAAAEALLQQGEFAAASELAQRAEQSLPGDRNDPAVLSTYRVLTLLAQAERNFDNLLRYSEKRRDTELAIAREKASQQLAYQLASGETRLKEQRIQLLDKDNELLTLERNLYQQQAENRYLMLLLIGSLSLILGLLTYRGLTRSKRYRKMAEYDQLTGISNRYHFTEQAQREIAHCIRAKRPVALILFDLDHFKNINDRFGHAAGDWTLRQVVLSCRNFIRHSDIFGRIGGEEFVILLTDCTAEQASMLAEICRTALADIDTSGYQQQFKVTASFGVADSNQAGYDLSALLAAADAAMYLAKQQGRNQVYCPATADGAV